MNKLLQVSMIMVALLVGTTIGEAQQVPDPRVADLVQAGKIRAALFPPQYTKEPATGELRGVAHGIVIIDLARALAARLRVEAQLVGYSSPTEVVECLKAGACDVAFTGITPSRAAEVDFSSPFIEFDFTYLVPAGSSIRSVADADRPGVRIAVVRNHASTLALSRLLKHAELVDAETPEPAFNLLRTGRADVYASARPALLDYSSQLPGSRVLEDRYGKNLVAMVVSKGQAGRLAYINEFIEEAKTSGWLQRAIERAGLRGFEVAPMGNPSAQK